MVVLWHPDSHVCFTASGLELPGINYKFNTKKYRFFYGSRVEVSPHPYKVKLRWKPTAHLYMS